MTTSDNIPNTKKTIKRRTGNKKADDYAAFTMYMEHRVKNRDEQDSILDPALFCRRCMLSYRQMHTIEEWLQDGRPVDDFYLWHINYHKENCGKR